MPVLQAIKRWFRRPLSCEDVNQFIIDYLEDNLPAKVRTRFEEHLAMCPNCSPYFDQYTQTIELVREQGTNGYEVPEEIIESTLAFLHKHMDGEA